jgi:uncharacterized protein (DUF433 family)
MDYHKIITIDPRVRDGLPCVRGLPITVADVIGYLASGMSIDQVLAKHTQLTREDLVACIRFAIDDFGGSGGGPAPVAHPNPPRPPGPTAAHKKLGGDDNA